ncbi:unnamed protein product [Schistosoma curassoni]|uniref:EF-hand domain-containing protein n=1 Tax=Schistosoma curassoni TaxID=6186 RepID=A0A3P7Z8J2_9TREM|nr:unnamed protein product [Schistosoma curassoni]
MVGYDVTNIEFDVKVIFLFITLYFLLFTKECPTGYLSIDDFKRVYTKFFPYGESSRFAEYVFRTFDQNHDGLIDFRDFLSSLNITNRGDLSHKLRWAFTMYDLDNDGYISKQDLIEVLTVKYLGTTEQQCQDVWVTFPSLNTNCCFRTGLPELRIRSKIAGRVDNFTYLGSPVSSNGSVFDEISALIKKLVWFLQTCATYSEGEISVYQLKGEYTPQQFVLFYFTAAKRGH